MITGGPKWNSHRTIAAPAPLLELLATTLRRRGLTGADQDALVFVGPDGKPLNYANWRQRAWMPACKAVGLTDLKFQALRTANTTAMVALAVDVKTAQTRAGHRNAKTTLHIYARPTATADREAAAKLGAWFLGKPAAEPDEHLADRASRSHARWTRDGLRDRLRNRSGNRR